MEDDERMVFRIIKYDKNWDKLDYVDINGVYTTLPFYAGAVRCTEDKEKLYIYATHRMYTYDDGLRHQASFVIVVDKKNMSVKDINSFIEWGQGEIDRIYVSHCFNNFVLYDSKGHLAFLSHGDAGSRSLELVEQVRNNNLKALYWHDSPMIYNGFKSVMYNIQNFDSAIIPDGVSFVDSMFWVNRTGCSVGGFEETKDGYVVAYNYDEHGGQLTPEGEVISPQNEGSDVCSRNIYIYFVNDYGNNISTEYAAPLDQLYNIDYKYKISYEDSPLRGRTPTSVSLGNDKGGVILWQESQGDNICYVRYYPDGSISDIYRVKGWLSDCKPFVSDGKVIWYKTEYWTSSGEENYGNPVFYTLDVDNNTITSSDWYFKETEIEKAERYQLPVTRKEILKTGSGSYEEVENKYDSNGRLCEKILNGDNSVVQINYDSTGKLNKIEMYGTVYVDGKYTQGIIRGLTIGDEIKLIENSFFVTDSVPQYYNTESIFDLNYNLISRTTTTEDSSGTILVKKEYGYDSEGYNVTMHYEGHDINCSDMIDVNASIEDFFIVDEKVEYDENHNIIKTEIEQKSMHDGLPTNNQRTIKVYSNYPNEIDTQINDYEGFDSEGNLIRSYHMVDGVVIDEYRRYDSKNFQGYEIISNDVVVSSEINEYDYSGTLIHSRKIEGGIIVSEFEQRTAYNIDTDGSEIEEKTIILFEVEYDENHNIIKSVGKQRMMHNGLMINNYTNIREYYSYPNEIKTRINDYEGFDSEGNLINSYHMVDGVVIDGYRRYESKNFQGYNEVRTETISNNVVVSSEIFEYDYFGTLIHSRKIKGDTIVSEYERSTFYNLDDDSSEIEEKTITLLEDGTYDKTVVKKTGDGLVLSIKKGVVSGDEEDWIPSDYQEYYFNGNELKGYYHDISDGYKTIHSERKEYYPGGEKLKKNKEYNRYDEYTETVTVEYDVNGNPTKENIYCCDLINGTSTEEQYIYSGGEKTLYQIVKVDANGKYTYEKP